MALSRIVVKYRYAIVIVFLTLTLLFGYLAFTKLFVNSNLANLAPEGDNSYADQLAFLSDKLSSNVLVVVAYTNNNLENAKKALAELKDLFESSGYILETMKIDDPEIFVKYGFLAFESKEFDNLSTIFNSSLSNFLDFAEWRKLVTSASVVYSLISEYAKRSGIERYILISPDQRVALINFVMKDNFVDVKRVNKAISELRKIASQVEQRWSIKFLFTGTPVGVYESNQQVSKDFMLTTLVALAGICIVIFISFGSLTILFLLLMSMIIGMCITLGIVNLVLGEINIVTSFVNAMILGLGIDYGIYIVSRIAFLSKNNKVDENIVTMAITELAKPSSIALLTTVGAFSSMFLGLSKPFMQMGVFAIFGMVIFYLTMMMFLPALVLVLRPVLRERALRVFNIIQRKNFKSVFKTSVLVFVITLVPLGLHNLTNYWYTPSGLISNKAESAIAFDEVKRSFQKVGFGEICLLADDLEELKRIRDLVKKSGFLTDPFSVLNILELATQETIQDFPKIYGQVFQIVNNPILMGIFHRIGMYPQVLEMFRVVKDARSIQDVINELKKDVPMFFYEKDGKLSFVIYTDGIEDIYKNNRLKTVFNYFERNHIKAYGYPAILYKVMKDMRNTIYLLGLLVFAGVFGTVVLTLRSLRKGVIILALLVLSIFMAFGIGRLAGIRASFLTLLILPILAGIGVDGFVHIIFAMEEKDRMVISKTLQSITSSSLTTIVAFGSFALAQGRLLREFGILMSVGMFVTWIMILYLASFFKGGLSNENSDVN